MSKRDELHKESTGEKGAIGAAILAIASAGISAYCNEKEKQEIRQKINDLDREIASLESKFPAFLYRSEINALKQKRAELQKKLK